LADLNRFVSSQEDRQTGLLDFIGMPTNDKAVIKRIYSCISTSINASVNRAFCCENTKGFLD